MLNYIWAFMLIISVIYGAWSGRLPEVSNAILDSSAQAVSLAISMAGVVALWCGLMEIAEKAGIVRVLSSFLRPVIGWLFPGLRGKRGERAREYITLNFIMNMLGTGWSATGPGLMAMEELARLKQEDAAKLWREDVARLKQDEVARLGREDFAKKGSLECESANYGGAMCETEADMSADTDADETYLHRATDDMCTFLVLNVSSLQLIPVNIIAYRSAYGAVSPTAIILPALLATGVSTLAAVVFCKVAVYIKNARCNGV